MRFEFEHLGTTTPFELAEGEHRLGGSPDDPLHLEGLPPRLLTLRIESQRLTVEAARPFAVGGVLVPPEVPRLVLPGESLELPEKMCLRVLAEAPGERGVGTVAVLKGLLTGLEAPPRMRAATLTCLTGLDLGRTHVLAAASTDIGRGSKVALRVRDRSVSRTHARILHHEAGFTLEDLGSPNGVFLNDQQVQGRVPLTDGDVLKLGRTLLRFQGPVEESAPPPPTSSPWEPSAPDGQPGAQAPSPASPLPAETPVSLAAGDTDAPPPEPRPRGEWWLIGLGAAAALAGMVVTYALTGG